MVERLKERAKSNGRSLQQELKAILSGALPLTPAERLAVSEKIAAMQHKPAKVPSEVYIRQHRDGRK